MPPTSKKALLKHFLRTPGNHLPHPHLTTERKRMKNGNVSKQSWFLPPAIFFLSMKTLLKTDRFLSNISAPDKLASSPRRALGWGFRRRLAETPSAFTELHSDGGEAARRTARGGGLITIDLAPKPEAGGGTFIPELGTTWHLLLPHCRSVLSSPKLHVHRRVIIIICNDYLKPHWREKPNIVFFLRP